MALAIDEGRQILCSIVVVRGCIQHRFFDAKDLVSVELFEDGASLTKTSRSSQVAGALVGGVALGGLGALIGGLTGQSRTDSTIYSIVLRVVVDDINAPLCDMPFLRTEVMKDSFIYRSSHEKARHWYGLISVLIKRAEESKEAHLVMNVASKNSTADELRKLAVLRADGVLTEHEFQIQKNKLLASS